MKKITGIIIILLIIGISFHGNGQIKLKDKLKKTENSVDRRTDQGVETGLDKVQQGLGKVFKKKDKNTQDQQGQQQQGQDQQNQPQQQGQEQQNQQIPVKLQHPRIPSHPWKRIQNMILYQVKR
jgi:FtsZ-interacting cell division protein ZipA